MDWDQLISGMGYGLWASVLVLVGRVIYIFGSNRMDTRHSGEQPKLVSKPTAKCLIEGLAIAAVLGVIASGSTVIRDGGDYLYDPGEIVEVVENKSPSSSFGRVFAFVSICWIFGAVRNDAE